MPAGWTELSEPGRCRPAWPLSWVLGTRGASPQVTVPSRELIRGHGAVAASGSGSGAAGVSGRSPPGSAPCSSCLAWGGRFSRFTPAPGPPAQKLRVAGFFFFFSCWGLRLF